MKGKMKVHLEREVKFQMDPNSPEWQARLAKIHADLEKKYDGSVEITADNRPAQLIQPGYRNGAVQQL